ncbi:porin [Chitinasiproducens palmae]|uniref:Outer membrane protein (Porin) n=1 Tax=Chitinasiproducens palmae TaxID=1770053 RepID=A0A1H2PJR6_9BURK|nr:porin [Chitinasiproducens palmae]SDV46115.1 Outer membrane protein (porin) [Chitinasiproducens palmae]
MRYAACPLLTLSLLCVNAAHAQSSAGTVTLYGSIDAGVGYSNNVAGHATWRAHQGDTQPDRWGLRGVEALGAGNSAIFQLENGFSTLTGAGTKSGSMFNRQAWVGLSSHKLGTVTLGHQTPFSYQWLGSFSSAYVGYSYMRFHPANIDALSNTSLIQTDNSIRYVSPAFAGFSLGALLALGNTSNYASGRKYGIALNYASGPFKAAATFADEHDRTFSLGAASLGLASFQGVTLANTDYVAERVRNVGAGASYKAGKFLFHGTYTRVTLSRAGYRDIFQTYDAGVNYQVSVANLLTLGAFTSTLSGRRWTQIGIGDVYFLSKRTQVYADIAGQQAGGGALASIAGLAPASTNRQVAVRIGMHHAF